MSASNVSSPNRLVLADGVFDPLHVGHVRYLQYAAGLGRRLVVNVAPDAVIRAKGRQPFQTCQERAETLNALTCVDSVVTFDTLQEALIILQPRLLVKGSDWRGRLPSIVVTVCREEEIEIVYTDTQSRSSTERLTA